MTILKLKLFRAYSGSRVLRFFISLVHGPAGPRFQNFLGPWSAPVRFYTNFAGPRPPTFRSVDPWAVDPWLWATHFHSIGTVQFHPFLIVHAFWDRPLSSFLITHLLLRTFHFHSFLAAHAPFKGRNAPFLNRPLYVVLDRPP